MAWHGIPQFHMMVWSGMARFSAVWSLPLPFFHPYPSLVLSLCSHLSFLSFFLASILASFHPFIFSCIRLHPHPLLACLLACMHACLLVCMHPMLVSFISTIFVSLFFLYHLFIYYHFSPFIHPSIHASMVWYGMTWYGMTWYGMTWYGMTWI